MRLALDFGPTERNRYQSSFGNPRRRHRPPEAVRVAEGATGAARAYGGLVDRRVCGRLCCSLWPDIERARLPFRGHATGSLHREATRGGVGGTSPEGARTHSRGSDPHPARNACYGAGIDSYYKDRNACYDARNACCGSDFHCGACRAGNWHPTRRDRTVYTIPGRAFDLALLSKRIRAADRQFKRHLVRVQQRS